ncbi:hypothetical protein GOODEAATRI_000346 [Goodea atripinnis]|uniref:Uncharacterized protein n=1 Tax=Goodea atripinnis TaxID=208336 RepID=A0ABV0MXK5_9TELE
MLSLLDSFPAVLTHREGDQLSWKQLFHSPTSLYSTALKSNRWRKKEVIGVINLSVVLMFCLISVYSLKIVSGNCPVRLLVVSSLSHTNCWVTFFEPMLDLSYQTSVPTA